MFFIPGILPQVLFGAGEDSDFPRVTRYLDLRTEAPAAELAWEPV